MASTLAKTLIRRRKELGKTQEQVAYEAGLDRSHYQLLEHARSDRKTNYPANPTLQTLIKLTKVLDCTMEELVGDAVDAYDAADPEQSPDSYRKY